MASSVSPSLSSCLYLHPDFASPPSSPSSTATASSNSRCSSSSSSLSSTSDLQCHSSAASSDSTPSTPPSSSLRQTQKNRPPVVSHYHTSSAQFTPDTSPESSCIQKPLPPPRPPRSVARPSSSCGLPARVNMAFGLKDKERKLLRKASASSVLRSGSSANDANTSISPTPERSSLNTARIMSATLGRSRKKSLASFLNSLTSEPPLSSSAAGQPSLLGSRRPFPNKQLPVEESDDEKDYGEVRERYQIKDHWARRMGMKMHPYGNDAPYMQSYDSVSLDSDRHSDLLLRRLNSNGSPSFHNYGKNPPRTVLDIGCGQGHWVLHAAEAWKHANTVITGIDMVNVLLPTCEEHENLKFVRGNFVKFPLPFPSNSFDMVRMANLTLCIPYERWTFVLTEACRVLRPGGRLELIDDQIFFPYGNPPSTPTNVDIKSPTTPKPLPGTGSEGRSAFEDDGCQDEETCPSANVLPPQSSLGVVQDGKQSFDVSTSLLHDSDVFPSSSSSNVCQPSNGSSSKALLSKRLSLPVFTFETPMVKRRLQSLDSNDPVTTPDITPAPTSVRQATVTSPSVSDGSNPLQSGADTGVGSTDVTFDDYMHWQRQTSASLDLERVFEKMLKNKFGIHTRPSAFALSAMKQVFGSDNAAKVKTMHLRLAPNVTAVSDMPSIAELSDKETDKSSTKSGESTGKKPWITIDWDKKDKKERRAAAKEASKETMTPLTLENSGSNRSSGESLMTLSSIPESISAKAAGRLGISYSELAAATASSARPLSITSLPSTSSLSTINHIKTVQSPGLVLLPSTLIPVPPFELEMHVCKHLHMLLACKPALKEFVDGFVDELGQRLVSNEEFRETFWEYEYFRRQRFNLCSDLPELRLDSTDPSSSLASVGPSTSISSDPSLTSLDINQLTHVRTIRVYEAYKPLGKGDARLSLVTAHARAITDDRPVSARTSSVHSSSPLKQVNGRHVVLPTSFLP